jgi:hypothetical protein
VTADLTEVEDRLYGADLDEFVKERAAAVKELRSDGRRDDAALVAKLAKPSVAAWIVNRVAHDEPGLVNDLLDAGARVRDVQLGAGSAADLRTAAEEQEAALRAIMRKAEKAAAARGSSTPATLEKVRETLRAGALDAGLAEQVRRGVLVREQRAVGFPLGVAVPAERRRPAAAKRVPKERRPAAKTQPRDEVAAKRVQRATAAAETARDDLASAEDDLSRARKAFEARTDEVESARRAVTAAERRAADARRAVERAKKAHARASQAAARAAAQLQELTAT